MMVHSGEDFGSDIVDLYDAGRFKMKVLADEFRAAGAALFHTEDAVGSFSRDAIFGGPNGPALAPWQALRDEVVDLLFTTAANMDDTGQALIMAADEYEKTDAVAAARYSVLRDELDSDYGVLHRRPRQ